MQMGYTSFFHNKHWKPSHMYRSQKKYKNLGICLGSLKATPKWTLNWKIHG